MLQKPHGQRSCAILPVFFIDYLIPSWFFVFFVVGMKTPCNGDLAIDYLRLSIDYFCTKSAFISVHLRLIPSWFFVSFHEKA